MGRTDYSEQYPYSIVRDGEGKRKIIDVRTQRDVRTGFDQFGTDAEHYLNRLVALKKERLKETGEVVLKDVEATIAAQSGTFKKAAA